MSKITASIKFGGPEHKGPLGLSDADDKERDVVLMGGDSTNPTWDQYLEGFVEEFQPYMEAARTEALRWLSESSYLRWPSADQVANDLYFQFSDGRTLALSWRAYGDFVQAIVGKREGYMEYYM